MLRLVRYPIKIQLPTAALVACCCFSFVDIIIKISPSCRDKRHCCLLSVVAIVDIHTEVICGISDIRTAVPIPSRRTSHGLQWPTRRSSAPENPSEPPFSGGRPVPAVPPAAVIAMASSASCAIATKPLRPLGRGQPTCCILLYKPRTSAGGCFRFVELSCPCVLVVYLRFRREVIFVSFFVALYC